MPAMKSHTVRCKGLPVVRARHFFGMPHQILNMRESCLVELLRSRSSASEE